MPYQAKVEPPVERLHLDTMQTMFDAHKMLYDFGYRGSFSTTASTDVEIVQSGRFDMVMDGAVPINASLGDSILYRTNPPAVVECITDDAFAANYEAI